MRYRYTALVRFQRQSTKYRGLYIRASKFHVYLSGNMIFFSSSSAHVCLASWKMDIHCWNIRQ